jgi:hypothetical protein
MEKIKFKIHKYDEESNSVIISFSSDETATNNPDDYEGYAFQPIEMYPDITDMETLKKKIAEQGISLANMSKAKEDAKANTTMQNNWKALVGQTFEYNTSDVQSTSTEVSYPNEINVPPSE